MVSRWVPWVHPWCWRIHGKERCLLWSATDFVGRLRLKPGTTILWHSVTWQYLDPAEQEAVGSQLDALATAATEEARFAHLQFEPGPTAWSKAVFFVRLRTWPGGEDRFLGEAHPHGVPVQWARR